MAALVTILAVLPAIALGLWLFWLWSEKTINKARIPLDDAMQATIVKQLLEDLEDPTPMKDRASCPRYKPDW